MIFIKKLRIRRQVTHEEILILSIFGIVRHKTRSLWAPLIMHVFNNLLAVLLIALEIGI